MMKSGSKLLWLAPLVAAVAIGGCFELTGDELCGPGDPVEADGASFCVYEQPIVIETGFNCPAELPFGFEGEGVTVCSSSPSPPADPFGDLLPMPGDAPPADSSAPADPAPQAGTDALPVGTDADPAADSDDDDSEDEADEVDDDDSEDEADEVDDDDDDPDGA